MKNPMMIKGLGGGSGGMTAQLHQPFATENVLKTGFRANWVAFIYANSGFGNLVTNECPNVSTIRYVYNGSQSTSVPAYLKIENDKVIFTNAGFGGLIGQDFVLIAGRVEE